MTNTAVFLDTAYTPLNLIKAGAGAGKTYHIQKTLIKWIKDKTLTADRILAVTFTKAAASELKERIKMALIQEGLYEESKLLDNAQISTIHQFGQKLLNDFSFEMGNSPSPRRLTEIEEKLLLKTILSKIEHIIPIMKDLSRFKYEGTFSGGGFTTQTDEFKNHISSIISALRNIGAEEKIEDADVFLNKAVDDLKRIYGNNLAKEKTLNSALWGAVKTVQSKYEKDTLLEQWGTNDATRAMVNTIFKTTASKVEHDWAIWVKLQSIATAPAIFNKKTGDIKHRDGQLAFNIWDAADQLKNHPGPLNDAINHITILLNTVFDALGEYRKLKQKNGLIDYNDMVQGADQILNNPKWLKEVKTQFDCLIIDEFQDTNPLQFSLLWSMQKAGVPALVVGDIKQSIMGFQGADSRLFSKLLTSNKPATNELSYNWRSTDALMEYVNKVGTTLYGKNYTHLTPKAGIKSQLDPVVFIDFPKDKWLAKKGRGKTEKHSYSSDSPYVICNEITKLLTENKKITDKNTGKLRAIRPNDIAILSSSHTGIAKYAKVLREFGIKPQLKDSGFLSSPMIEKMRYAMSYLANSKDKHALLYLTLLTDKTFDFETWFKNYLKQSDKKKLHLPLKETLKPLGKKIRYQSLPTQINTIIETLGLWDDCTKTETGQQQRANLLKLIFLAETFEESQPEALEAQGIYGKGMASFIVWLKQNEDEIDTQPKLSTNANDAVVLSTWHAAKGLEWPIVIVVGMEKSRKSQLPHTSIQYGDTDYVNGMLNDAYCQLFTKFDNPSTKENFIEELEQERIETIKNLTYVVLTRAREQLILPWFKTNDTSSMNSLIEDITFEKAKRKDAFMPDKDLIKPYSGNATHLAYGRALIAQANQPSKILGQVSPSIIAEKTPKTASSVDPLPLNLNHTNYGKGINLTQLKAKYGADQVGTWVHQLYQAIFSNKNLTERALSACPQIQAEKQLAENLVKQINSFKNYLITDLKAVKLHSEYAVLAVDKTGATVSGIIDLLVETEDGFYIIDHKTDAINDDVESLNDQFKKHFPQLLSYKNSFNYKKPIIGIGVNWVMLGKASILLENNF